MYRLMTRLFRRILVPHDFSEHATAALRVAAELAAPHRRRLTVLHVLAPFYTGSGFPTEVEIAWVPTPDLLAELQTHLERTVGKTLHGRMRGVECRAVVGDPASAIVAASRDCDTIVMATLGRTGLSHLLIGSVAEKVVRLSPVPVLTIRPAAARRVASRTRRRSPAAKRRSARRA